MIVKFNMKQTLNQRQFKGNENSKLKHESYVA